MNWNLVQGGISPVNIVCIQMYISYNIKKYRQNKTIHSRVKKFDQTHAVM